MFGPEKRHNDTEVSLLLLYLMFGSNPLLEIEVYLSRICLFVS